MNRSESKYFATAARMDEAFLELLEKKVDKHNSVVERTFKLEEQAAVFEEKIKVANHRIEDLENR